MAWPWAEKKEEIKLWVSPHPRLAGPEALGVGSLSPFTGPVVQSSAGPSYLTLAVSILWHSAFFMAQLSHPYTTTEKTIALWTK